MQEYSERSSSKGKTPISLRLELEGTPVIRWGFEFALLYCLMPKSTSYRFMLWFVTPFAGMEGPTTDVDSWNDVNDLVLCIN